MTALDVSALVSGETDSKELTDFKAKVVTTARKYAQRNGWCETVEQALIEMGAVAKPVFVTITFDGPFDSKMQVSMKAADLHGKTEDEQKQLIADQIGDMTANAGGAYISIPFEAKDVSNLVLLDPNSFRWAFMSADGRVLHAYKESDISGMRTWLYSACGKEARRYDVDSSTRDTSSARRCVQCSTRAAIV